jgi:glutathione S-transferase
MIRLHDFLPSGNCYKIRLLLKQLDIRFERIDVDILAAQSRDTEFLEKNPNGRVPLVELDDGRCLWESAAILWYFADGTRLVPGDSFARAQMMQWMCFEQYSHEPYIATSRFWLSESGEPEKYEKKIASRRAGGIAALEIMQEHLLHNEWFAGNQYSIADIALYAYTHVADKGNFDLSPYPALNSWLARVCSQPLHIPIDDDCGTPRQ